MIFVGIGLFLRLDLLARLVHRFRLALVFGCNVHLDRYISRSDVTSNFLNVFGRQILQWAHLLRLRPCEGVMSLPTDHLWAATVLEVVLAPRTASCSELGRLLYISKFASSEDIRRFSLILWQVCLICHLNLQPAQKRPVQEEHSTSGSPDDLKIDCRVTCATLRSSPSPRGHAPRPTYPPNNTHKQTLQPQSPCPIYCLQASNISSTEPTIQRRAA